MTLEGIVKGSNSIGLHRNRLDPGFTGLTGLWRKPYPGAIGLAGLGRVIGLRLFPYSGAIGLVGLARVKLG
jgi:hypothetical protein